MGHILWPVTHVTPFHWPVTRMTRDPWPSPRSRHESITTMTTHESWWVHDYCLLLSAMMCNLEFWILLNYSVYISIYTVSQKNKQNYFCYNYVKLPLNPTIFGTKMANCLKLYEMHSFFHLSEFMSVHNRVNRRCSELTHNAVGLIVSVRLLTNSTESATWLNYFVV